MPFRRLLVTAVVGMTLVPGGATAATSLVGFQSPSQNIGCYMDASSVRCDIRDHRWPTPKRPSSCELDYGGGVFVGRTGRARYICAGDTALNGGRKLAYGKSLSRGRFTCTSRASGMRCVNGASKHGFELSRERVKLF